MGSSDGYHVPRLLRLTNAEYTLQSVPVTFLPWSVNNLYTDIVRHAANDYTIRSTNPLTSFNTLDKNGRGFAPYIISEIINPSSTSVFVSCNVSLSTPSSSDTNPRISAGIAFLDSDFNKLVEIGLGSWSSNGSFNTIPFARLSPPRTFSSTDLEVHFNNIPQYAAGSVQSYYRLYNGEQEFMVPSSTNPKYVVFFMRGYGAYTARFTNIRYNGSLITIPTVDSIFNREDKYIVVKDVTTDARAIDYGTATFSNCMTLCNTDSNCKGFEYSATTSSCTLRQNQDFVSSTDVYSNDFIRNFTPSSWTITMLVAGQTANSYAFYNGTGVVILKNFQTLYQVLPSTLGDPLALQFDSQNGDLYVHRTNDIQVYVNQGGSYILNTNFTINLGFTVTAGETTKMFVTPSKVIRFDNASRNIHVYDKATKTLSRTITNPPSKSYFDIKTSSSGSNVFCLYQTGVDVYDTETGSVFTTVSTPSGNVNDVFAVSSDGNSIAIAHDRYYIDVYTRTSSSFAKQTSTSITVDFTIVNTIEFDPSGIYLATAGTNSTEVRVFRKLGGGNFLSSNTFTTEMTLDLDSSASAPYKNLVFNPVSRDIAVLAYPNNLRFFLKQKSSEPDRIFASSPSLKNNLYMKFDVSDFNIKIVFNRPLYDVLVNNKLNITTLIMDASSGTLDFLIICDDIADTISGTFIYHAITYPRNSGTPRIGFRFPIKNFGDFYLLTDTLDFKDIIILNNQFQNVFELEKNADITFTKSVVPPPPTPPPGGIPIVFTQQGTFGSNSNFSGWNYAYIYRSTSTGYYYLSLSSSPASNYKTSGDTLPEFIRFNSFAGQPIARIINRNIWSPIGLEFTDSATGDTVIPIPSSMSLNIVFTLNPSDLGYGAFLPQLLVSQPSPTDSVYSYYIFQTSTNITTTPNEFFRLHCTLPTSSFPLNLLKRSELVKRIFDIPVTYTWLRYEKPTPTGLARLFFGTNSIEDVEILVKNHKIVFKTGSTTIAIFIIVSRYDVIMIYTNPTYRSFFGFDPTRDIYQNILFSIEQNGYSTDDYYKKISPTQDYLDLNNSVLNILNAISAEELGTVSLPSGLKLGAFPNAAEEFFIYKRPFNMLNGTIGFIFNDDQTITINDTAMFYDPDTVGLVYTYKYYIYNGFIVYINDMGVINVLCTQKNSDYSRIYRVVHLGNFIDNVGSTNAYKVYGPYVLQTNVSPTIKTAAGAYTATTQWFNPSQNITYYNNDNRLTINLLTSTIEMSLYTRLTWSQGSSGVFWQGPDLVNLRYSLVGFDFTPAEYNLYVNVFNYAQITGDDSIYSGSTKIILYKSNSQILVFYPRLNRFIYVSFTYSNNMFTNPIAIQFA